MKKTKKLLSLLVITVLALSSFCFSSVSFAEVDPIGYWTWFIPGGMVIDQTGNSIGAHTGNSAYDYFALTGSNYAYIWNTSYINVGTGDFSIACSFRTSSTKYNNTILDKRTSADRGYHLTLIDGRPCLQMCTSSSNLFNYYSSSTPSYNDGLWHNLIVSVDRNSTTGLKFYVDGSLILTMNPTGVSGDLTNTVDLYIGKHRDYSANNFVGDLDEIKLYNAALY